MSKKDSKDKNLNERRLAAAWAELQAHSDDGNPLQAEAYRLAFSDPEFLLRRETRGIRMQLEMLKPDLEQQAQGIENTVVVYGSARFPAPEVAQAELLQAQAGNDPQVLARAEQRVRQSRHYEQARQFAHLVATDSQAREPKERMTICTGGGPGIMEAANRGAFEAGALNVGLSIALPFEASGNQYITPSLSFKFHYFALRKMHFLMRSIALVCFPGGFGTLDELFETLTLIQTGKCRKRPVLLFGREFWTKLINFDHLVDTGMISPEDLDLFRFVETADEAWETLQQVYGLGQTERGESASGW